MCYWLLCVLWCQNQCKSLRTSKRWEWRFFFQRMAMFFPPETSYLANSRGNNRRKGMQRISTGCSPPFCHLFSASTDVIPLALQLPLAICQHSNVLLIRGFAEVTQESQRASQNSGKVLNQKYLICNLLSFLVPCFSRREQSTLPKLLVWGKLWWQKKALVYKRCK